MDPILYWNDVALEANRESHTNGKKEHTGPTASARALAIVHLAMYDAFVGASQSALAHYLTPKPASGSSAEAAVAAAAHATLSGLFPAQRKFFDEKHAGAGLSGPNLKAGHEFGLKVAKAILLERKDDPDTKDDGYAASVARGAHRPDPDNPDQGYYAPFFGAGCKGFAITARHELDPPPQPGGQEYRDALREVRGKGVAPELAGTLPQNLQRRTPDETVIGLYWAYDGASGLGTPPRLYNQIVRKVAQARNNTPERNARLFALVNVAMADAGILAWDQKYLHDLWRPVVGVREHDPSMGPAGSATNPVDKDCQPDWLPLGAPNTNTTNKNGTPHFPAYPSGHATFGAASLHVTRLFYAPNRADGDPDDLFDGLNFVSDELNGVNKDNKGAVRPRHARSFENGGLWRMIVENGLSRVYLGVHWVFDAFAVKNDKPDLSRNIGGVPLGLKVARDIFEDGMQKSNVGPRT